MRNTLPVPMLSETEPGQELGDLERWASHRRLRVIAGIDEAGRGPLAGPVVAACVLLPPQVTPDEIQQRLCGLNDSKKLKARVREGLFEPILSFAMAVGVGEASASEIDEINVLQATRQAMRRALERAVSICGARGQTPPELVVVDGNVPIDTALTQRTLVGGDRRSFNVAAASIIAKVTRDRFMVALDGRFPGYGFARHKGYPTPQHREALRSLGPCPEHRQSFRLL